MRPLVLVLLLTGCSTAEKLTHRAVAKDARRVREITRDLWPCITVDRDTVYKVDSVYDIIAVDCPDTIAYRIDTLERNTAVRVPYRVPVVVYKEVPRIRETRTITIRTKDTTHLADNAECEAEVKSVRKWKSTFMWAALAGWLLFILSLFMRRK